MILTLLCMTAYAEDNEANSDSAAPDQAEYIRLTEEMENQAARNNWAAVERNFRQLEDTDHPIDPVVWITAAHSARDRGDITSANARLKQADALTDDEAVDDWLQEILNGYGQVWLAADLTDNYRLRAVEMPFAPEQRKAVEFAQQEVFETSSFQGLLPNGKYVFEPYEPDLADHRYEFEASRTNPRKFDVRTHDVPTRRERRKRAKIDRKVARREAAD